MWQTHTAVSMEMKAGGGLWSGKGVPHSPRPGSDDSLLFLVSEPLGEPWVPYPFSGFPSQPHLSLTPSVHGGWTWG